MGISKVNYSGNTLTRFVVILFIGEFGVHKFIDKKTKMGLLYLFTCGLFGFGWLIDLIIALRDIIKNITASKESEQNVISQFNNENLKEKELKYIENSRNKFREALDSIPNAENFINTSAEGIKKRPLSDIEHIEFTSLRKNTPDSKIFPLVVIDVETTGINKQREKIVELAAIKYEKDFTPTMKFTTLINPEKSIPKEATSVNGITDDMVSDAPKTYQIMDAFNSFISGCNVVGHNLDFDLKFLYIAGMNVDENVRYYDTLEIARKVISKNDVYNYKLGTLCNYYRIFFNSAHRALADCYVTGKLFENLFDDIKSR